jgi:4'-phosphopantetheinyl transferase
LVTVFAAMTAAVPDALLPTLADGLDAEERHRAGGFLFERDRRLFIIAHALLHAAIGSVLGPHGWRLHGGDHGRPALTTADGAAPPRFSLSHTSGLAVCVLAADFPVGVDAEAIDRSRDINLMAARYLAADERAQLAACAPADRMTAFYRFWTLKEATAKALGLGLTLPLTDLAFGLDPLALRRAPPVAGHPASWHLREFAPTPVHRVALAVQRPHDRRLAVRWQPVRFAVGGRPASRSVLALEFRRGAGSFVVAAPAAVEQQRHQPAADQDGEKHADAEDEVADGRDIGLDRRP